MTTTLYILYKIEKDYTYSVVGTELIRERKSRRCRITGMNESFFFIILWRQNTYNIQVTRIYRVGFFFLSRPDYSIIYENFE